MGKPENPPAFPNDPRTQLGDAYQGMTLRDYFAGQALAGLMSAQDSAGTWTGAGAEENAAVNAYAAADAMLAHRNQEQKP